MHIRRRLIEHPYLSHIEPGCVSSPTPGSSLEAVGAGAASRAAVLSNQTRPTSLPRSIRPFCRCFYALRQCSRGPAECRLIARHRLPRGHRWPAAL